MRITKLAEDLKITVNELKVHLETIGVPEEGRTNLSGVPPEVEAQLREMLSSKTAAKVEKSGENITTLPNGKKVILLFSPVRYLTVALKNGYNVSFSDHQMVLDTEDEADMSLYNLIMRIGVKDAFVVLPEPYSDADGSRDEFERKLQNWLVEPGEGSVGAISLHGSRCIQALFHRDEQSQLQKKRNIDITPRTLKMAAVNGKSLAPAKF